MKRSWLTAAAFSLLMTSPAFSQSGSVVKELSSRTGIPVAELKGYLSHCEASQLSMNICADRDFVASDLQLEGLVKRLSLGLNAGEGAALARVQQSWLLQAKTQCNAEVKREVGQFGSMRPMVYGQCMAAATQARAAELRKVLDCPHQSGSNYSFQRTLIRCAASRR